jgi:hypothetical protein
VHFKTLTKNGHYRDYGMDFLDKMKQVYDEVKLINLKSINTENLGINGKEMVFIGKKVK